MATAKHDKPRGVLNAHRPPSGAMSHERWAPPEDLREQVEHFWSVRWDLRGHPPHLAETLPHPSVHLTIEPRSALVGGVSTSRFTRRLSGKSWVFAIKFRPGGFYPYWRAPLSRLANRTVPIRAVFGAEGSRFAAQVRATDDLRERLALAEAFLRGQRRLGTSGSSRSGPSSSARPRIARSPGSSTSSSARGSGCARSSGSSRPTSG